MTRQPVSAVLLLAGLVGAGMAPRLRGQLDTALLRQGGHVLYYLHDHRGDYQTVGVLPFLVQKGSRGGSFEDAPLALNLTTRLENALIVSQNPAGRTIGVIRDAAGTASQRRVGPYRSSPAALQKLFALDYNLAWGKRTVKADVFLTGTVINSGKDRSQTKVVIEAFDAKSMKAGKLVREKVCEFDLPTDRSLLSDLGYAWALSATVLRRGYSSQDRDRFAVRQVARIEGEDNDTPKTGQSKHHTPGNIAGLSFEIHYDDVPQRIKPLRQAQQGKKAPLYTVAPSRPGTRIALVLKRIDKSERTLGVVVKVNGQSTFQSEDLENIRCRKWLFDNPKRRQYRLLGFYKDDLSDENVHRFSSLSDQESEAAASELGGRAGWIDVEVFASAEADAPDEPTMMISARGVRWGKTLRGVQGAIRKANNIRVKQVKLPLKPREQGTRSLWVPEVTPSRGGKIEKGGRLPNPQSLGSLSIRYSKYGGRP